MATLPAHLAERRNFIASAPPAVTVVGLSKTFRLPHQRYSTFKERALHPLRSSTYDELHAVKDATFTVGRGEFFGIVGRNGSGKSTLLKCMAGIYDPDRGRADVEGRLSPFIELGVGMNPELSARDNVLINAVMLGLSRRQARERFDSIVRFAELEEFIDLKLKNYSSGMSVRLAFSVAIQVDADVILVDEVLAVGDAAFQHKCYEQFQRLKDEGRTIVLVTHDMATVQRFCDRAMLMERGAVLDIDEPEAIARAYNEVNFGRLVHETDNTDTARYGDHARAAIVEAWFEDATGARVSAIAQHEPLAVVMEVLFRDAVTDPIFGLTLRNDARATIFATSSLDEHGPTGGFDAGRRAIVRVTLDNHLAPSTYTVSPSVARDGADVLDVREDLASLVIHATRFTGGVVDAPHEYAITRL